MVKYSCPRASDANPDFNNLLKVLRRQKPDRPTLFELFLNDPLYRVLAGKQTDGGNASRPYDHEQLVINAYHNAGYDYAPVYGSKFAFPSGTHQQIKTRSLNEGGIIKDRKSFEEYPWPDPDNFDCNMLSDLADDLPDGMKLIVFGPGGVLENVIMLAGFDNLCWLLADDPKLTMEIFDAVGSRLLKHYQKALEYETVGAIIGNDDWGFKTQPMLSPADMRKYVFPWHKQIVAAAHVAGRPAILHSCGNLDSVMNDIIRDIGYDAKHSYEDTIKPVEEAYEALHGKIAVLGGMDLDFMTRATPDQIYRRARAMLERVGPRGAYALGTGNSVPEFIPHENYFAMLAAARDSLFMG